MQFRCRIPADKRFFVPLCNTQHGAYESDSSLHRRLFTDGNFEKNRPRRLHREWPARRELQCSGKCGGRSGRRYKCRRRQRGKGVHHNRPDACGGKTARAAGRCRGGIRRAGIRGPRGACGIGEAAGDSRRGNAGRSAGGLRQPGFSDGGRTTGRRSSPSGDSFPWRLGLSWANTRTARPARRSPKDVPIRRTSPKRPLSERASAKSLRTERPARSTPQNSASRIRRCCQNCGSSVSCWGTAGGRNALRPYCSPRATPHGAPNAAAASRSVPRGDRARATNCTPTRRAASAAVHASKAARSAHARSGRLSPPFCRATSPGANHP